MAPKAAPSKNALSRKPDVIPSIELGRLREARLGQLGGRFLLGAAASVLAALIAKFVGARIGGVFLAFPAILPASLTIIQDGEGTVRAGRDAMGAVVGGLALLAFAAVGEVLFSRDNPALVLVAALGAWAASAVLMYALVALVRPDCCDKRQE